MLKRLLGAALIGFGLRSVGAGYVSAVCLTVLWMMLLDSVEDGR